MLSFAALLLWPATNIAEGVARTTIYGFTDLRAVPLLSGELPPGTLSPVALARPFDYVIRFLTDVLRVQALTLALQLLSLPVHLRGLSLKRRFSLAFGLYRAIPALLTGLVMLAGVYFGLGLYKSRVVNHGFLDTAELGRTAAAMVLARQAGGAIDGAAALEVAAQARPWLSPGGSEPLVVLRRVVLPANATAPADSADEVRLPVIDVWSSPGTPEALANSNLYGAGEADTVSGLFQAKDRFYIASILARKHGGEALVSEVYVPVDSLYLAALAERAGADLRLQALPGVRISSTAIQIGGDDRVEAEVEGPVLEPDSSAPRFTIAAPYGVEGTGLLGRKRLVSRQFLPTVDWWHETRETSGSTALLTLSTSPRLLLAGIVGAPYVLSSNLFAIAIFAAILILYGIAESSAVRTGRSIIDGILEDARGLAAAAQHFGSGDFEYRIGNPGKDELGRLAATFNAMAEDLKKREAELIEKERLEADLASARRIQERLLPQEAPKVPGLDVAGVSVPSLEVGGDLFHFLLLDGDRLGLAIGDVSGKSMPAALLMSNALAILRAETRLENDVAAVLTQMNALIAEQVETGKFLTFIYGVVDPRGRRVRYACAGHNPPLLVRADGGTEWLEVGGLALGILPETTYAATDVELGAGDVLVLYSDGVTEASRPKPGVTETASPDDEDFFGEERLLEAVRDRRTEGARGILDGLVGAVKNFVGDAPQSDDLTVVVVKVRGEA